MRLLPCLNRKNVNESGRERQDERMLYDTKDDHSPLSLTYPGAMYRWYLILQEGSRVQPQTPLSQLLGLSFARVEAMPLRVPFYLFPNSIVHLAPLTVSFFLHRIHAEPKASPGLSAIAQ